MLLSKKKLKERLDINLLFFVVVVFNLESVKCVAGNRVKIEFHSTKICFKEPV